MQCFSNRIHHVGSASCSPGHCLCSQCWWVLTTLTPLTGLVTPAPVFKNSVSCQPLYIVHKYKLARSLTAMTAFIWYKSRYHYSMKIIDESWRTQIVLQQDSENCLPIFGYIRWGMLAVVCSQCWWAPKALTTLILNLKDCQIFARMRLGQAIPTCLLRFALVDLVAL